MRALLSIALLAALCAGCGYRGPLYLPASRPPAANPPPPAPAPRERPTPSNEAPAPK